MKTLDPKRPPQDQDESRGPEQKKCRHQARQLPIDKRLRSFGKRIDGSTGPEKRTRRKSHNRTDRYTNDHVKDRIDKDVVRLYRHSPLAYPKLPGAVLQVLAAQTQVNTISFFAFLTGHRHIEIDG